MDLINKAYVYAAKMHDGQMRKSGDPYFIHPVSVANTIARMELDTGSVCAALLHDVVEDTAATRQEVEGLFGSEVAFLVDGVTKLGRVNFVSKEDQQAESLRKMVIAMSRDIRVLLVKLADRLDNMRTLKHMVVDKQESIARETLDIYAPLAGRMGIYWIKSELQDLAFRYLYPEQYSSLQRKSELSSRDREKYLADVSRRIEQMLIERNFAVSVSGRTKELYSIYTKMRQQSCDFEMIHDHKAFRVVVEDTADCYAALGVIHSQWTPIPGRFKDFIALPKPNMYQSLHTTVIGPGNRRIEVQIRTQEMHRTAENGIAAHCNYKSGSGGLDPKEAAGFAWLRQLVELQRELKDPVEFMEGVKVDLFTDEVYVFTPKGDVRTFPRGATVLDFAYAIHTEIGERCTSARIDGTLVSLRHELHSGDTIEIITSARQRPAQDWLEIAKTSKARSHIRTYTRQEERGRSLEVGRDLLERGLSRRDRSLPRLLKSGAALQRLLKALGSESIDDVYASLAYGRLAATEVVEQIEAFEKVEGSSWRPGLIEKTARLVRGKNAEAGIRIDASDDTLVHFATCCSPVRGDPVFGFMTRGRGVTVHRRDCAESMKLDPTRRVEVRWEADVKETRPRPVSVRMVTVDKPGILTTVTAEFHNNGLNITEATCRSMTDGRSVNLFQFSISDVGKLRDLIRRLAKIEGVYEVERV